jgi:catechol 2,3-dioxygenase-like lactoylglutathione lyase family enzyme
MTTGEFGLSTIGQIAVHVQDPDRAVAFYRDQLKLLLRPVMAFPQDSEGNIQGLRSEVPRR